VVNQSNKPEICRETSFDKAKITRNHGLSYMIAKEIGFKFSASAMHLKIKTTTKPS